MWESAKEFGRELLRWWWIVVFGVGGGLVSFMQTFISVPMWISIAILLGGPFVASFIAFHKVRDERDAAKQQLDSQSGRQQLRLLKRSVIEKGKKLEKAIEATFCTTITNIDHLQAKVEDWMKDAYANMIEYQDPLKDEFGEDAVAQIGSLDRVKLRDFVRLRVGWLEDSLLHG